MPKLRKVHRSRYGVILTSKVRKGPGGAPALMTYLVGLDGRRMVTSEPLLPLADTEFVRAAELDWPTIH